MTHNGLNTERELLTDGGQSCSVDETQKKALEQLFIEVTGTDIVTEPQDAAQQSRNVSDQEASTVSGYVAEVTKNDGLEETLPEPDSGSSH